MPYTRRNAWRWNGPIILKVNLNSETYCSSYFCILFTFRLSAFSFLMKKTVFHRQTVKVFTPETNPKQSAPCFLDRFANIVNSNNIYKINHRYK